MHRNGSFALLFLAALAAVLTLWLGPRPVRELWYAEELLDPRAEELFPGGLPSPSPRQGTEAFARELAALDGIAPEALPPLRDGCVLLDADGDGDLDAICPPAAEPAGEEGLSPAAEAGPLRVWWNDENRSFREVGELLGPAIAAPRRLDPAVPAPLRAVDADRDGRVDLVLALADGRRLVLWNRLAERSWIRVRLIPGGIPPPGAVGRVELWSAGRRQIRLVPLDRAGRGVAAEAHFGLGDAERAERVEVVWPSGRKSVVSEREARREIEIAEPGGSDRGEGAADGIAPRSPGAGAGGSVER